VGPGPAFPETVYITAWGRPVQPHPCSTGTTIVVSSNGHHNGPRNSSDAVKNWVPHLSSLICCDRTNKMSHACLPGRWRLSVKDNKMRFPAGSASSIGSALLSIHTRTRVPIVGLCCKPRARFPVPGQRPKAEFQLLVTGAVVATECRTVAATVTCQLTHTFLEALSQSEVPFVQERHGFAEAQACGTYNKMRTD